MSKVILYEHGCPNCKRLKMKLDQKGIQYEDITDIELMKSKGFHEAPKLELADGTVLGYINAVKWVNNYSEEQN